MIQQIWAFVMGLTRWPDGVVVKVGNELRTGGAVGGGTGVLCDDTGRLLLDHAGRILTDTE